MPDVSMCIYMLVIGEGREEKGARTRHKEKVRNMQSHARARTHVKNSLSVSPLCAGDTCGTGRRHLAGADPQSASYVAPFLCDRLVVKCSLPDLPSFSATTPDKIGMS